MCPIRRNRPNRSSHRAGHALVRLAVLALGLALGVGCEEPRPPDTTLFERAEEQLRRGDFDDATRNYEAFIEQSPRHPLVAIARTRLRNIDRELEAVMGRRSTPAPIYIRPVSAGEEQSERPREGASWDSSRP